VGKRRASQAAEPPSDPPFLNATAHVMAVEVQLLFQKARDTCGIETAIFLFNRLAKAGRVPTPSKDGWSTLPYPTAEKVDAADRRQICLWYSKLCAPKDKNEKSIFARIQQRYLKFGGATQAIRNDISAMKPPPPKKRKGPHNSKRELLVRSDLLVIFDESDPESWWSLAKQGRLGREDPRPLTKHEFAKTLVPAYGGSAEHILRKLKYLRTKN
jgi:hypothetical protein